MCMAVKSRLLFSINNNCHFPLGIHFEFGADSYVVNEGDHNITLHVVKQGVTNGITNVMLQTLDGSASTTLGEKITH